MGDGIATSGCVQVAVPNARASLHEAVTTPADFEHYQRLGLGPEHEFGTSGFFVHMTTLPAAPVANGATTIDFTLQDYRRTCAAPTAQSVLSARTLPRAKP